MTPLAAALQTLNLPPAIEETIGQFEALFQKWNRRINLSAARTDAELQEHLIDSLQVVPHLRAEETIASARSAPMRILDVGAGGGFPTVIAAICLPGTHVTTLEPVHKKHAFLRTAARELSLNNLAAHAERVEDHPHHDYDATMSRATFDLREWLLRGLDLVRPGGLVLGFEAVPRSDLPSGFQRYPYDLGGKSRAIVTLRRPA
jgi:16S rRNA (guanine527-N7)-methyltransferase